MANKKANGQNKGHYQANYEKSKARKLRRLAKRTWEKPEVIKAQMDYVRSKPNKQRNHRG